MVRYLTPSEYLASIASQCRRMTAEQMLRNMEQELDRHRRGYGHYLFDDRHGPVVEWEVPGLLEHSTGEYDEGLEVAFDARPFDREDVNVEAEEGLLEVTAVHRQRGPGGRVERTLTSTRRIVLPRNADIEGISARLSEGTLVVRVPVPERRRRTIEVE